MNRRIGKTRTREREADGTHPGQEAMVAIRPLIGAGIPCRPAAAGRTAANRRLVAITAVMGVLCLLVVACQGAAARSPAARRARKAVGVLSITPGNGSRDVKPSAAVRVAATHAKVTNVVVTTHGTPVRGHLSGDGTVWHSMWPLRTSYRYTVTATGVSTDGKTLTATSSFRTLTPSHTVQAQTLEGRNQTYGVGMPIIITFSRPVKRKAAVERTLQVEASRPALGAWYWDGDQTLYFRPRGYWRQHTRVRFVAHLDGVEVAPGVYGTADLSQSFTIGNSLIAVVSTTSHYAKIYYRGKLFGNWPVSTGQPGDDTANGTYLTIEKANPTLMSGPGYTNFPVPYAVRFTWSGNYMHDAYWSVAEQGFTNVSHGCVNMSPAHAISYYNLAVPGDPVTVTGSPVAGTWGDGWTVWFLTWRQLLRGSALHKAVVAGPGGSGFVSPSSLPPLRAPSPLKGPKPGNSRSQ